LRHDLSTFLVSVFDDEFAGILPERSYACGPIVRALFRFDSRFIRRVVSIL
jgi:hypothetical protein